MSTVEEAQVFESGTKKREVVVSVLESLAEDAGHGDISAVWKTVLQISEHATRIIKDASKGIYELNKGGLKDLAAVAADVILDVEPSVSFLCGLC